MLDPRVFMTTALLGYDYALFISTKGVLLIAVVLALIIGGVRKWRTLKH